jgi:hypothetical protein
MQKKVYSIDMMYKRILALLTLFTLFISPLVHVSIEDASQTRTTWSWLIGISCIIIAFFATHPFRVQKIFHKILILTAVLGASTFFIAIYPPNAFGLYLVVLAILISVALQHTLSRNPQHKIVFAALILCCLGIYAQWGIAQFIVQHDLGMRRIGESVLTPNLPGIASFYLGSEKFIRAYGPFGHSNSFAGVLLLGIILVYKYGSKFKSSLFLSSILFIISLGIIVSFSRAAILGLVIIGVLSLYKRKGILFIPVAISMVFFIPLLLIRSLDTHGAAAHERLLGLEWLVSMMNVQALIRGFGIGNYTNALTHYIQTNSISHNPWDIAPIHSVPLLLISELGLIISIPLFLLLFRYVIAHKLWILIALLPALLFDHYFATQLSPFIFLITTARLVV